MASANVNIVFIINAIFINICAVSYIHDETKEINVSSRHEM